MKFFCPKCKRGELTLADRVCPNPECALRFTLRGIARFWWQGFASRWRKTAPVMPVRCPHCQQAASLLAKECPNCKKIITVADAVAETSTSVHGLYHRKFDRPAPEFVKRLQWGYFLLSVALLFIMLSVSGTSSWLEWGWSAALSVVYLAAIVMLLAWLVPRSKRTTKPFAIIVRLAFVFNVVSFAVLLQLVIRSWWLTFVRLAGVLLMIVCAMVLLYRYLWPMKDEFQEALNNQRASGGSFDHLKPQGRKGARD